MGENVINNIFKYNLDEFEKYTINLDNTFAVFLKPMDECKDFKHVKSIRN